MLLLAVFSLNSFYSRVNYCKNSSFRWCGIFLRASARLAAAEINASLVVMIVFVIYLCLTNKIPETLGARVFVYL